MAGAGREAPHKGRSAGLGAPGWATNKAPTPGARARTGDTARGRGSHHRPLPRRFLSLSQPLPPRGGDVKIPRKSRVVAPRAEARFRRPAFPYWGRLGEGQGPARRVPFPPGRIGRGEAAAPDAAGRTPPAPNLIGKFTFQKQIQFQYYFRRGEACPEAESDRKKGEIGSLIAAPPTSQGGALGG
jgi:hypothetical protein